MNTRAITHDGDCSAPGWACPPLTTMAELIENAATIDNHGARAPKAPRESTETRDPRDYGTHTMPDAVELARHGWPDGAAMMARLTATTTYGRAPKWRPGVAGAFPVVGDYTAGRPDCMRARRMIDGERHCARAVTIYAPVNVSAIVPGDAIMTVGAALLGVIDALETSGTSVRLIACKQNAGHLYRVLVKQHGEHCDVDRLAYALANPSMPRRMLYAWCERRDASPATTTLTCDGYGMPPCETLTGNPGDIFLPRVGDSDVYGGGLLNPTTATATAGLRQIFAAAGVVITE